MTGFQRVDDELARRIVDYALARIHLDPPPLDRPRTAVELAADVAAMVGEVITPDGIGGATALQLFTDVLAPAVMSTDHPGFLAFVPAAPTDEAVLFDLVVGATSMYAGSWLEGAGVVFAENQALRWLADLAGFPPGAGGVFVSGGPAGNLSALVAARHHWRTRHGEQGRAVVAVSDEAHSSVHAALRVMDADALTAPLDEHGRLTADALAAALDSTDTSRLVAVVATAGTTNAGVIDDLPGIGALCNERGLWLHVDGAYGLAALASPSARARFAGIERADSFVVDPHKWLFAPYDCAALLYRDPEPARMAHTQTAAYLDPITARREWNPSDYAFHLTRRARGLPFWYSLAANGTNAYARAIDTTLELARTAARLIDDAPHLELLLEPELSVVLFRRDGWTLSDYQAWSDQLLAAGTAFVVPSSWQGEPCLRLCFVNPATTPELVKGILATLA